MVQNRSQNRARRKNTKSMKTNNTPSFLLDFGCLRGSKIEEKTNKRVSKTIQNRRVISKRFFKGFLSIFGPFWEPRSTQNRRKSESKTRPIFSRSCMVGRHRSTLAHGRPNPPWTPHNSRPIEVKNNRDSKDRGKIRRMIQKSKEPRG